MRKTYKVNDIFYSLQGEGRNTGMAAIFVRFSGCNLKCPFCDTVFSRFEELTGEEITCRMRQLSAKAPLVVLTGGEPTMQVDEALLRQISRAGYPFIAMESNGMLLPPEGLDWLTVSPKGKPKVTRCNELKVIFDGESAVNDWGVDADYYYLQPMDTGDEARNAEITNKCVEYIKQHPEWRLSLQTHKLTGFK